jgi:DNA-binding winged helix-turn-helix (wHTH) protein/predicted ATPase
MSPTELLCFGEFLIDFCNACVWKDHEQLPLTMKAFAVLGYLVTHPNRILSKNEIFAAVWPGVVVSDWALATCVREIRRVLGDEARNPRIIETVYGRGYRFIAAVTAAPVQSSKFRVPSSSPPASGSTEEGAASFQLGTWNLKLETLLVGRESELTQLHSLFDKALNGTRQVVFVTGEPGIGKTTLIEAFLGGIGHWELGSGGQKSQKSNGKSQMAKVSEAQSSALSPQSLSSPNPQSQILNPAPWIGRGQCIEQYGAGEAYLPVLEALGRLARTPAGPTLKAELERYAPTWLLHLPALLSAEEAAALQPRVLGVLQERMMRELAEALEVLTREQLLILVFEDLHWADASTLTLLSVLAHRQEPARLMILGTYRPSEAAREGSPLALLTQELAEHHHSHEVAVRLFDEPAVVAYLAARFPVSLFPTRLASVLYQRTEGNPLFVVSILDDLIARGVIAQSEGTWALHGDLDVLLQETPEGIRQLVSSQRARLRRKTRRVLEAASVAGMEFSAPEVAAALETAVTAVEDQCAQLAAQQQFLRPAGISEWPDHTMAARYAFLHAVYQAVWHEQVSPTRLQEWHRRIGERKEVAYGDRTGEIAAELAVHFEQGHEYGKALQYLSQAAGIALRRAANPEAINYLTKALEMLVFLPDTPERAQHELQLQVSLGTPLMLTRGYAAPEVKGAYDRARELCREIGETLQLFPVLVGLCRFYVVREDFRTASELGEQILRVAQHGRDPSLMLVAHMMLGGNLVFQGEFVRAQTQAAQGLALFDPRQHRTLIFLYGDDPEVPCLCWAALTLWYLGYPDQALERISQALRTAQEFAYSYDLTFARFWTAFLHQARGEVQRAQEQTEALIMLTQKYGILPHLALGVGLRGWVLAEQGHEAEGIAQVQQGLAMLRTMGQELGRPYFLALLAEAYGQGGQAEEGLPVLTEALEIAHTTGECMHQAELYRLKGTLTLQSQASLGQVKTSQNKSEDTVPRPPFPDPQGEAEACFLKAIEIARQQQAKSLELRATISLARLWQQQGKAAEAHQMLSKTYGWFTEGFDTKDLRDAKALLDELGD